MVKKLWQFAWRPSATLAVGTLVLGGLIAGSIFWGTFIWALEASNTEEFCIGCHEMRVTVYEELKKTVHFSNPSGVRATCPDCHVPKSWIHKVYRKASATINELPKHLIGAVDTIDKFEARRLELAQHVWDDMKATDSRECRNCHRMNSMALADQKPRARGQHESAIAEGETCIDCHKGIAHKDVSKQLKKPAGQEGEGFTLE